MDVEIILDGDELVDPGSAEGQWKQAELIGEGAPRHRRYDDRAQQRGAAVIDEPVIVQPGNLGLRTQKFVEIAVTGATSDDSARRVGLAVANSPLVKTAIAGEDANWGRVVMAVGKAGEPADRDKLSISFNGIRVAKSGARDPSYDEAEVSKAMKNDVIRIKVALGLGKGRDRVLTCDLTKEYVAINGDYRS